MKQDDEAGCVDEQEKSQHEDRWTECLETSPVRSLFPLLRQGLWHVNTVRGYQGIRREGCIKPNTGQFPFSYTQSANRYGTYRGYVSLFDFETPSREQCIDQIHNWARSFTAPQPSKPAILVGLNREALTARLIRYEEAHREVRYAKVKMPVVEVWYPEAIPVSAVISFTLILPSELADPLDYFRFDADDTHMAIFDQCIEQLLTLYVRYCRFCVDLNDFYDRYDSYGMDTTPRAAD